MATPLPTPVVDPSDHGYDPFPNMLNPYIGAVFLETFLYGVYTVLFFICIYVLLRRRKPLHWILLASAVLMFSIATADISYTYYLVFAKLMDGDLSFKHLFPKYILFVTNNVLADTLLLYRCYVVWGCKKRVVVGPALLLVAGTVCGYLFEGTSARLFKHAWIYLSMTFALNIILTALTAGKIWYLAHKAEVILGQGLLKRYNATIAILIESGVLYSIYIVLDLAFQNDNKANTVLDAGLIQVVGIMPTLIIVQVGLGRAVHDLEANEALARIDANKAANRSYTTDGGIRSFQDARSFRDGIRSLSDATTASPNGPGTGGMSPTARSFKNMDGSFNDTNASRRTLHNTSVDTGRTYTDPYSNRSLPPSPVLSYPAASRSFPDAKTYQSFPDAITLVHSRDSYFSNDTYYSAS